MALARDILYITNMFQIWNDHFTSHMDNFSETGELLLTRELKKGIFILNVLNWDFLGRSLL